MRLFLVLVPLLSLLGKLCSEEIQTGLMKEILPSEDELRWQKIAWKTDLWEARKVAAKEGKPIYLWEMDGHPLGCV